MGIKFSDFEDNDRKRQLSETTKADYWEVQADMWHQNYKEAADEIEQLRQQNVELVKVLKLALSSHNVFLTSFPGQHAWEAYKVSEKAQAAIAKATGDK